MLTERYLFEDPALPALQGPRNPPFCIDSHGSTLFGRILLPAQYGEGDRSPVLLQLHGFPGLEQNLDLPYALRRAGIATAHFSYRGVWGCRGDYSFSHLIEDVFSVRAFLADHAEEYGIDPKRIYLFGHSMGGFAALNALARGLSVRGAIIMAPCDLGFLHEEDPEHLRTLLASQEQGYFTLTSGDSLTRDVAAHAHEWRFLRLADRLPASLPIHFIAGSKDVTTPPDRHLRPLYEALCALERPISYTEFQDDHAFPASRVVLTQTVFRLIKQMEGIQP